jgi:hypothetical protein
MVSVLIPTYSKDVRFILLSTNFLLYYLRKNFCLLKLKKNIKIDYNEGYTGRKIIYSTHILHISYTYQYLICVVLYNMNAENPTHIVYI